MDAQEISLVYENVLKMLKYRNITRTDTTIDIAAGTKIIMQNEYIQITGTRSETDPRGETTISVFIIAPGSDYAIRTADFRKLLSYAKDATEVMIVSHENLPNRIIKDLIGSITKPRIEYYSYDRFIMEIPAHVSVPKHIIMTEEETREALSYNYIQKEYLPKILQTDAIAVWLGLRPGMVIKIIRNSETAGNAIAYRICK